MSPDEFAGHTALITGAGSGIGAATARLLAQYGAAVAVTDINPAGAEKVAKELIDGGGAARAFAFDVGDPAAVQTTLEAVEASLGLVDILVNNAATGSAATFLDYTADEWRRQMDVNLMGPFLCSQAVVRRLLAEDRGGAIVNVASAAGLTGVPPYVAYVAAKHGLVGLTKVLAMELGPHRIRVNAVAPGTIATPPTTAAILAHPGGEERVKRSHPLGRHGEPEEVARLIAFLASSDASFMTGSIVPVDGGYLAGKRS
jgi:3-oxoacyl-[acyl-carrier protein] reductase